MSEIIWNPSHVYGLLVEIVYGFGMGFGICHIACSWWLSRHSTSHIWTNETAPCSTAMTGFRYNMVQPQVHLRSSKYHIVPLIHDISRLLQRNECIGQQHIFVCHSQPMRARLYLEWVHKVKWEVQIPGPAISSVMGKSNTIRLYVGLMPIKSSPLHQYDQTCWNGVCIYIYMCVCFL
jgi:hypothetical protein